MSRIYFHSQHGEAEVYGSERAYMGIRARDFFVAMLDAWDADDPITKLWPTGTFCPERYHVSGGNLYFKQDMELACGGYREANITIAGKPYDLLSIVANTALVGGGDALGLMARIHAQCEVHGYVEGPHRAWMADIIERGRADHILRSDMGWESVVELLRSRDDGPVVTSYSVCEGFPNSGVTDWKDEHDGDDWYELSSEAQWNMALRGIREINGLEWNPEWFFEPVFVGGHTAFTMREFAETLREKEIA